MHNLAHCDALGRERGDGTEVETRLPVWYAPSCWSTRIASLSGVGVRHAVLRPSRQLIGCSIQGLIHGLCTRLNRLDGSCLCDHCRASISIGLSFEICTV